MSKESRSKSPLREQDRLKPQTAPAYKGKRNKIVSAIQNKRIIQNDPSSIIARFYENNRGKRDLHKSDEIFNPDKLRPMTAISTSIKKLNQEKSDLKSGID